VGGWILEKYKGMVWTGLFWLRIGTGEESNEIMGSVKGWDFLE
jgi:hypothetical protein